MKTAEDTAGAEDAEDAEDAGAKEGKQPRRHRDGSALAKGQSTEVPPAELAAHDQAETEGERHEDSEATERSCDTGKGDRSPGEAAPEAGNDRHKHRINWLKSQDEKAVLAEAHVRERQLQQKQQQRQAAAKAAEREAIQKAMMASSERRAACASAKVAAEEKARAEEASKIRSLAARPPGAARTRWKSSKQPRSGSRIRERIHPFRSIRALS